MRRNRFKGGGFAIYFALGLLISCFCPPKFLIAVLAIWIIILGFCCAR